MASTVTDFQAREAKQPQGGASRSIADLFRLDARSVLVTGGAGALGLVVAESVLESGGDVICLDVHPEPLARPWAHLEDVASRHGRHISYLQCDITDASQVAEVFSRFKPTLQSPLRGLVSCAGVSDNGPSIEFPVERFRTLMDINAVGTFTVAQAVACEMRKTGVDGSMVLVASMSGTVSNKGVDTAAYNSSKSAVLQLARSLAAEWGSRVGMPLIRVNTLSPGYIRTVATSEALKKPGMESQWCGDNMLNRLSQVDEYRGPVLYLLSDASSFMTAADLRVDGGHCSW